MEKGDVCIKASGREKGEKCVVVNIIDENFAEAVCKGRKKRRKVNMRQLEATGEKVNAGTDEEALKAI